MQSAEFENLDLPFSNNYEDFRLTFASRGTDGYTLIATVGDIEPVEAEFELDIDRVELERLISRLGQSRSASRAVGGLDHESELEPLAQTLGERLAEAIMRDRVKELYDSVHGQAEERGGFVRMRLLLTGAPDLLGVPWEFMSRDDVFLASQRLTPIVRELETNTRNQPVVLSPADKLRILVVISSPADLNHLDADEEQSNIEQALAQISDRVEITWLGVEEPCSREALREVLQGRQTFHILHFIGHGAFSDAGQGVIYLTDRDGNRDEIDDDLFAHLVGNQRELQLVVLNSCEGAASALDDPYEGFAGKLVKRGCDAVVAMQFEITDAAAIEFAGTFYRSLLDYERPVDQALADARLAIMSEVNRVEWATPVLFLRDGDGILFKKPLPPPALSNDSAGSTDSTAPSQASSSPRMAIDLDVATPEQNVPSAEGTPKRRSRRRWWIVGGVVSALLIGVVIWAALSIEDIGRDAHTATASCIDELFAPGIGEAAIADPNAGHADLERRSARCESALGLLKTDALEDHKLYKRIDDRVKKANGLLLSIDEGTATQLDAQEFDANAEQQGKTARSILDDDFNILD